MKLFRTVAELPPLARTAVTWFDGHDASDVARITRDLLSSPVMNPVWRALKKSAHDTKLPADWPLYFILQVTGTFVDVMTVNPPQLQRTDAERRTWLDATLLHTRALTKLLADGEVNFTLLDRDLMPDDEMVRFLSLLGVPADPSRAEIEVDSGLTRENRRRQAIPVDGYELSEARLNVFVYLDDALRALEAALVRGIESAGPIRKPRDDRAPRASFIFRLSRAVTDMGMHISDSHLADLSSLVLNDDSITRSLVSRFRFRATAREPLLPSA